VRLLTEGRSHLETRAAVSFPVRAPTPAARQHARQWGLLTTGTRATFNMKSLSGSGTHGAFDRFRESTVLGSGLGRAMDVVRQTAAGREK
jgi:polyisoprenoid-binding protein YceI